MDILSCPPPPFNSANEGDLLFNLMFLVPKLKVVGSKYKTPKKPRTISGIISGIYCQLGDDMLPIPPMKGTRFHSVHLLGRVIFPNVYSFFVRHIPNVS